MQKTTKRNRHTPAILSFALASAFAAPAAFAQSAPTATQIPPRNRHRNSKPPKRHRRWHPRRRRGRSWMPTATVR